MKRKKIEDRSLIYHRLIVIDDDDHHYYYILREEFTPPTTLHIFMHQIHLIHYDHHQ